MGQPITKDYSEYGVLARIEVGDEGVRLVLEDVTRSGASWKVHGLFTDRTYPAAAFLPVSLKPEECQDLGFNVAARLAAFYEVLPPKK